MLLSSLLFLSFIVGMVAITLKRVSPSMKRVKFTKELNLLQRASLHTHTLSTPDPTVLPSTHSSDEPPEMDRKMSLEGQNTARTNIKRRLILTCSKIMKGF